MIAGFFHSVLKGWLHLGRGLGGLLLFLAAIAAGTAAVVLPLWLLATHAPRVFTAATVAAFAAVLLLVVVAGARRQARLAGGWRAWVRTRLRPAAARVAVVLGLVAGLYGLLLLLASGRPLLAVPAALILVVLLGLWARRRNGPPHGEARTPADDRGDGSSL